MKTPRNLIVGGLVILGCFIPFTKLNAQSSKQESLGRLSDPYSIQEVVEHVKKEGEAEERMIVHKKFQDRISSKELLTPFKWMRNTSFQKTFNVGGDVVEVLYMDEPSAGAVVDNKHFLFPLFCDYGTIGREDCLELRINPYYEKMVNSVTGKERIFRRYKKKYLDLGLDGFFYQTVHKAKYCKLYDESYKNGKLVLSGETATEQQRIKEHEAYMGYIKGIQKVIRNN